MLASSIREGVTAQDSYFNDQKLTNRFCSEICLLSWLVIAFTKVDNKYLRHELGFIVGEILI